MKKLISGLLLAFLICCLPSCSNNYDPLADGNYRLQRDNGKPIMKTISMAFTGDIITQSEEPLLRAEDDGNVYAAINVWRTKKEANAEEEKYAYGLFQTSVGFDILKDITIDVLTGYTYRFEATILIEREDKVYHRVNGEYAYQQPFRLHDESSQNFDNAWGYAESYLQNTFRYTWNITPTNQRPYFCELTSGTAYVNSGRNSELQYGDKSYPRVKRYYGKTPDGSPFDPEALSGVEINMGYKCFGLLIKANKLPGGIVTVKDVTKLSNGNAKAEKQLLEFAGFSLSAQGQEWEGLFSMNQLLAESETFNLEFTWDKGGGEKETFTSGDVVVHPKNRKILNIDITGTINSQVQGNITLTKDSESLTDEDTQTINN